MSESRIDGDVQELRARFQELRARSESTGRVPEFRTVLARAEATLEARPALEVVAGRSTSSRRWLRTGAWASAALAATVAGLLLVRGGPSSEEDFARLVASYSSDVAAGAWQSPTSALLDVPGMDLMRSMPSIGTSLPDFGAIAPPEPADAAGRNDA
jgi:hypothetical protein